MGVWKKLRLRRGATRGEHMRRRYFQYLLPAVARSLDPDTAQQLCDQLERVRATRTTARVRYFGDWEATLTGGGWVCKEEPAIASILNHLTVSNQCLAKMWIQNGDDLVEISFTEPTKPIAGGWSQAPTIAVPPSARDIAEYVQSQLPHLVEILSWDQEKDPEVVRALSGD
jgi:hypothetical protein